MPPSETLLLLALQQVLDQQTLSREAARILLDSILEDQDPEQSNPNREPRLAALLGALAARGETEDELAGFVDSLRSHISSIALTSEERSTLVDTCGTGGDLSGTFNISTAAALVAAAAGATVAKHGNRAVSSRSGSADVLEAVGIPVELTPAQAAAALRTHRFAFLSAPSLQPAMRAVMPLRRALGVRTAFNILGPMTNPAGARAQVLGVYAAHLVPRVAHTLARLDTRHAFVVHGSAHLTEGQEHLPRRGGLTNSPFRGPSTSVAEVSATIKVHPLHSPPRRLRPPARPHRVPRRRRRSPPTPLSSAISSQALPVPCRERRPHERRRRPGRHGFSPKISLTERSLPPLQSTPAASSGSSPRLHNSPDLRVTFRSVTSPLWRNWYEPKSTFFDVLRD